jgi:hypothetical protein
MPKKYKKKWKRKTSSKHETNILDDVFDIALHLLWSGLKLMWNAATKKNTSVHSALQQVPEEIKSTRQQFGEICYTKKGEEVKSRGEKSIADFLYKHSVNYEYEKPLQRPDGGVQHPDFYLSDYDVYIEYYGMLGDKQYNREISLKKKTYDSMNIKVIDLYPNNLKSGNLGAVLKKRFEVETGYQFPATEKVKYYAWKK